MRLFVVILVLVINIVGKRVLALHPKDAITTKYTFDWRPDGYSFEYETSSGIFRKERGYFKNDMEGKQQLVTEGEFSYIGDDNQLFKVSYVADENGYRPTLHSGIAVELLNTPPLILRADPEVFISSALQASLLGG